MSDTEATLDEDAGKAAGESEVDQAVVQGGAYEVLHRRLTEQGTRLRTLADALNAERLQEFGSSRMEVVGRMRVRTENNCVARDLVQVGDLLLFGYNVFIGLKRETGVGDVFSLYRLEEGPEGYGVTPVDLKESFLGRDSFVQDFRELYTYYKDTRLLQLVVRDGKLLAAFQIGERVSDIRVFRWAISVDGRKVEYIDNRGERDIALPPAFDFEWTEATREMVVNGRHPHLNVLDTVFVETVGGDLTIKVENNTDDGLGIYREPVDDTTQSLDDADIAFARVGSLVLLRILPYREEHTRYLVYNTLTQKVRRVDAIGQACVQLPEDHGIVFPGGYYLQNGEYKTFEQPMSGMRFKRAIRSPNGEDVLYIFYEPESGRTALFTYNMIQRTMQTPILGHGYARIEDGRMVVFSAESEEPTRIHPMQVWDTPFASDEFAARQPSGNSFMARIGNAELVRGVSDLYSLVRETEASDVSVQRYQLLTQNARRLFDLHHWIEDPQCGEVAVVLREIAATGEAVQDEYEKVESIRAQSVRAMQEAETAQRELLSGMLPDNWSEAVQFVDALNAINRHRGHLLTIREYRYIAVDRIDRMEEALREEHQRIAVATGEFLASEKALQPYADRLLKLEQETEKATSVSAIREPLQQMDAMSADLDMLSELMTSLPVDDATRHTRIVEAISGVYARLNQAKARAERQRRTLGSAESVAQFGAQFSLFSQSIASALALSQDPEKCEEQLSRLLVQLEELESQFGEHDQFLGDILAKREELLETFEAHKQALLDDRQRKAQSVADAAARILEGLGRRTARFSEADELNAFFAGDPLILKLRELAERLRSLKDNVKADDVEARLKGARDQAVRTLRDRSELFEGDGNIIRLGPRHRFSVNTQELDLTILPRGEQLALHLNGTDFFDSLEDPELSELRDFWQVSLESESNAVYRGEYLADAMLEAAARGDDGLSMDSLRQQLARPEELVQGVRAFAAPRYREGYERGIHDHDAALILQALIPLRDAAGTLLFEPDARALAMLAWARVRNEPEPEQWPRRARSARRLVQLFASSEAMRNLEQEVAGTLGEFLHANGIAATDTKLDAAAAFLVEELAAEHPRFPTSRYARALIDALGETLSAHHGRAEFEETLAALASSRIAGAWAQARAWLQALSGKPEFEALAAYVDEAAALLLLGDTLDWRPTEIELVVTVDGLLGEHPRIGQGAMTLAVDEFSARLRHHRTRFVPGYQRYQALRQQVATRERERLRVEEFKPRPLSSFVRNRLINDVYLAAIGDNLAKQMGTAGEDKRSDLMGLLMMISPPGYGKTTLMEYVAHRLGLVFMKINGPALGHEVRSLDPSQAPDATSRQELEKLNLALEMGSNVMLYVDDIQHTHPEFLQKFISLCDGTRRIEGVWKGRTRTYDMRGKKFCVVMAGNPYTESGEVFKIPDMLANRADIYNLGDVLGGMEDAFKLSYIENSLTSNPVLAPLATRDLADLYRLVDKVEGKEFSANSLSHSYSAAEINEIGATLERLMQARDVVYRVNQQYIASAAQADRYRTEPSFRLQGSYRNMNKLAEKISPVMNPQELQQLIDDHYLGEAQLLTTGAEENLLKLAELRGNADQQQQARWEQIKRDFMRNKAMGGEDADTGGRVVAQLADLVESVRDLQQADASAGASEKEAAPWGEIVELLQRVATERAARPQPSEAAPETPALDAERLTDGMHTALASAFAPFAEGLQACAEQQTLLVAEIASRLRDRTGRRNAGPGTEEQQRLDRALSDLAERLEQRRRKS